jgi:hypothetical protein
MGKRKLDLINDQNTPVQLSLLSAPGTEDRGLEERAFPKIVRDAAGFKEVLRRAERLGLLFVDYEFRSYAKPTIMGIAVRDLACGLRFDRTLHSYIKDIAKSGIRLVAHSGFGADKPVFDAVEGFESPWEWWEDSMLVHWFENSHLTKAPSKDESDDAGALGFMDLYSATSLVARVPNWKECRGSACHGPCPYHLSEDYCAIDAWAGGEVFIVNRERLMKRGFQWRTYTDRAELSNYLFKMEQKGVKIDREFIANFGKHLDKIKEGLFPENDKGDRIPFNPNSSSQVVEWFKQHRLNLKSNQKNDIRKALEIQAVRNGYVWTEFEELEERLNSEEDLGEPLTTLWKLDQYKGSGKDPTGWFNERYFDREPHGTKGANCVHPRPIAVGTSTGRLSYAKPNFQNLYPLVKAAIIPHETDFDIIDADLGQLEFRDVLFQAGFPMETIKGDALAFILETGGSRFDRAAQLAGKSPRDIVKTVVYGGQYGESLTIYTGSDLMRPSTQNEISKGAIRLYTPQYVPWLTSAWEYGGGIVGFTGSNLAERLFGDKTFESRRKALEIQDDIIFSGDLKIIRQWQIKVCQHIELHGSVTLPNGQFLRLNDTPRENAKVGFAFLGQGYGSIHAGSTMRVCIRENKHLPLLQVHDSLVYAVNRSWSDRKVREFMAPMFGETEVLPGFKAPGKVKRGRNYGGFDKELNPGGLKLIWNSAVENVDGSPV